VTGLESQIVTFASALSAIVLNALWQDALIVLSVWLLLKVWPKINAATRYVVWSATLAAAFLVPVATTLAFFTPAHVESVSGTPTSWSTPAQTAAASRHQPLAPSLPGQSLRPERLRITLSAPLAVTIFVLWLLLATFALLRLAIGLLRLEQLKRDALPLPVEYRDAMPQWLRASKGSRDVRLCVSDETDVPVAVGLFDAMILVPHSLLERLSEPEVDQICLHELAHLRRADDWTNGVQRVINGLLGWNPAAQFIGQQLDLEREVACDDWVLSFVGQVRPYALCLTKMAESAAWPRHTIPAPGVFATRKHISLRIERLLGAGRNIATNLAVAPAAAAITMVAAIALVIGLVAPSIAAAPMVTPAKPAVAARPAVAAKPAVAATAPRRQVTRFVRVAVFVTPSPAATRVSNIHVEIPATHVEEPPIHVDIPKTDVNVPKMSIDVPMPGFDAKGLANKIQAGVTAGLMRGLHGTSVAQGNACVGCDYSGVNWSGRDMHGVTYNGVDFSKANLSGVNFSGSAMNGADFGGANLANASFRNAHLTGCDFSNANLSGVDFTNAWLSGCQFTGARLGSSQLREVLHGCKGCDFSRADLSGLDLHGVQTNGDDFSGADLRNVNFAGAQLLATDFSDAKLDGADFTGATLNGCDLSGVDLHRVDLSKAKLIGTDLEER